MSVPLYETHRYINYIQHDLSENCDLEQGFSSIFQSHSNCTDILNVYKKPINQNIQYTYRNIFDNSKNMNLALRLYDAKKLLVYLSSHAKYMKNMHFKYYSRFNLLNRGSIKLLEISTLCDCILKTAFCNKEILFGDLCCIPGGWSDILYQMAHNYEKPVISYGISLFDYFKYKLDIKFLEEYQYFTMDFLYGDICQKETKRQYIEKCQNNLNFVLADGCCNLQKMPLEIIQENFTKEININEIIIAFQTLKDGGFFIIKLFDIFLHFTRDLIYILSRCFTTITLLKLKSSRPTSSEKYLVCKNFKLDYAQKYLKHLQKINKHMIYDNKYDIISMICNTDDSFNEWYNKCIEDTVNMQISSIYKYVFTPTKIFPGSYKQVESWVLSHDLLN
uniref:Ribosomal RNA methyltransferase FtsJ domain-containing protein n=1 Tax=Faxonius propinquus nudivirus TaxID=3139431 RepID=A0AAU8GCW7_9VIRU